jgi:phosphoglycolate phosphatase
MTIMPLPKAMTILFDLDGTLIDSARITAAIIDTMLAARGSNHRADPGLVRAMDAKGGEAMIAAVMGRHCGDPASEIADFRARHADWPTPADLAFEGVAETLQALTAAGMRLAICSSKPQPLCEKLLADLSLASHFCAIVGSRPGLARKPSPEPLLHAIGLMGADPASSLYVGDSAIDAEAAAAAGVRFAIAGWGYATDPAAIARTHAAPLLADITALAQITRRDHAGCRRG